MSKPHVLLKGTGPLPIAGEKPAPGEEKHISQLTPTERALFQQSLQDTLLCIVGHQPGGVVRVPIDTLDEFPKGRRLVLEADPKNRVLILRVDVLPNFVDPDSTAKN